MAFSDNTTTWRDLADQLTTKQFASLEDAEKRFARAALADDPDAEQALLEFARSYAAVNLVSLAHADVAPPEGAFVGDWERDNSQGGWSRSLEWANIDEAHTVFIDGRQKTDGSYTAQVSVYGPDDEIKLSAEQARDLAGKLVRAADTLESFQ